MSRQTSILLIDDDPVHLQIYRMIVETAGFKGIPVLVSFRGISLPQDVPIDAVLLDYRLAPNISASQVLRQVKEQYPSVPILLLSDMFAAPDDIAPLVQAFVRKGNPERLLTTLRELIQNRSGPPGDL
jgi:DNA-binding response OmpR family regulator